MKKGISSNSSPKTFSFVFSARGTALKENLKPFYLSGVPLAEKTMSEVFGKGSGKEPFSRKVCPSSRYKLLYNYRR